MNKFYDQHIILQWAIALLFILIAGSLSIYMFELIQKSLLAILLMFIASPLFQFLIAPLMKLTGGYKYVSPMLLIYGPNSKQYDLHNGTSFDYLMILQSKSAGLKWQYMLLQYYLDGLLEIIREVEEGEISETVEIRGTSYFFSDRTANKLGFELAKPGIGEKINIIINYIDLIWMYSLSKGRLTFPRLTDIKTATISGQKLVHQKDELLRMKTFLTRRSN